MKVTLQQMRGVVLSCLAQSELPTIFSLYRYVREPHGANFEALRGGNKAYKVIDLFSKDLQPKSRVWFEGLPQEGGKGGCMAMQ